MLKIISALSIALLAACGSNSQSSTRALQHITGCMDANDNSFHLAKVTEGSSESYAGFLTLDGRTVALTCTPVQSTPIPGSADMMRTIYSCQGLGANGDQLVVTVSEGGFFFHQSAEVSRLDTLQQPLHVTTMMCGVAQ